MSFVYPKSLTSEKFPDFIREFPPFKRKNYQVKKAFSALGLKNCSAPVKSYDPKDHRAALLKEYRSILKEMNKDPDLKFFFSDVYDGYLEYGQKVLPHSYESLLSKKTISRADVQDLDEFIQNWDMRVLPVSARSDLFVSRMWSLKIPSSSRIHFSADGMKGAWDMATMSMRGIRSCQSWNAGESSHLVGSVADPFCGIIYMTAGDQSNTHKTIAKYGSKMICRAVVRILAINETDYKGPGLFLEPVYRRGSYDNDSVGYTHYFIDFLKRRTKNIPIWSYWCPKNSCVPESKLIHQMRNNKVPNFRTYIEMGYWASEELLSYSDEGPGYRPLPSSPKFKQLRPFTQ